MSHDGTEGVGHKRPILSSSSSRLIVIVLGKIKYCWTLRIAYLVTSFGMKLSDLTPKMMVASAKEPEPFRLGLLS